jgi:hypothetical protein
MRRPVYQKDRDSASLDSYRCMKKLVESNASKALDLMSDKRASGSCMHGPYVAQWLC